MTHIWSSPSSCLHIYNSIQSIYGIYMAPPSLHSRIYDSVQSIFNLYTILYSIYMTHIWSSPCRHLHICDSIQYIFSTYIAHIRVSPRHCSCIYDSVQSIFNPYLIHIWQKISQSLLKDWLIFFYFFFSDSASEPSCSIAHLASSVGRSTLPYLLAAILISRSSETVRFSCAFSQATVWLSLTKRNE